MARPHDIVVAKYLIWLEMLLNRDIILESTLPEKFSAKAAFNFIRSGARDQFLDYIRKKTTWEAALFDCYFSNDVQKLRDFQNVNADHESFAKQVENPEIRILIKALAGDLQTINSLLQGTFYDHLWAALYVYLINPSAILQNTFLQEVQVSNELEYFVLENVQDSPLFSISAVLSRWTNTAFWSPFFASDQFEPNFDETQDLEEMFLAKYGNSGVTMTLNHLPLYVHLAIINFGPKSPQLVPALRLFLPSMLHESYVAAAAHYAVALLDDPADEMARAFAIMGEHNQEAVKECIKVSPVFGNLGEKVVWHIFHPEHSWGTTERRRSLILAAPNWVEGSRRGEVALQAAYVLAMFTDIKGASLAYGQFRDWIADSFVAISEIERNFWEKIVALSEICYGSGPKKALKVTVEEAFKAIMAWADSSDSARDKAEKGQVIEVVVAILVQTYGQAINEVNENAIETINVPIQDIDVSEEDNDY